MDETKVSSSLGSGSETLVLGDLLEVLVTVVAVPTHRDFDFVVLLDTVVNVEEPFLLRIEKCFDSFDDSDDSDDPDDSDDSNDLMTLMTLMTLTALTNLMI